MFDLVLKPDLSGIFKRKKKEKINDTFKVAYRFIKLFNDHGISLNQIPSVLKDIKLKDLKNIPESLVDALTDDILNKTSEIFGVRRDWLDGVSNQMYKKLFCYKMPQNFFEDIADLDFDLRDTWWPVISFTDKNDLNKSSFSRTTLVLVLAKKITTLNENIIYKYRIYGDDWYWEYPKCNIQLRAMIRVLHHLKEAIIPIYRVDKKILEQIVNGRIVPNVDMIPALQLNNVSLEDFSLSPEESAVSKDSVSLPAVDHYIEIHDLYNVANKFLKETKKGRV